MASQGLALWLAIVAVIVGNGSPEDEGFCGEGGGFVGEARISSLLGIGGGGTGS